MLTWRMGTGNCHTESAIAGIKCADPNGIFLDYFYVCISTYVKFILEQL